MRKTIFFAISLISVICIVAGCSKETPVVEKKFTEMELNAFTVDAYRFRVSLNNEVVTDSLITPQGSVGADFYFTDYHQRIRVYNTADKSLLIDTPYTLSVGKRSVFTIYQTQPNTAPFFLAPSPAEPLPGVAKSKLSIICSGNQLSDSVRVLFTDAVDKPLDSIRLKKDNFSPYIVLDSNRSYKVKFYKIPGNNPLGEHLFVNTALTADFNIYRLMYTGSSTLTDQKLY